MWFQPVQLRAERSCRRGPRATWFPSLATKVKKTFAWAVMPGRRGDVSKRNVQVPWRGCSRSFCHPSRARCSHQRRDSKEGRPQGFEKSSPKNQNPRDSSLQRLRRPRRRRPRGYSPQDQKQTGKPKAAGDGIPLGTARPPGLSCGRPSGPGGLCSLLKLVAPSAVGRGPSAVLSQQGQQRRVSEADVHRGP